MYRLGLITIEPGISRTIRWWFQRFQWAATTKTLANINIGQNQLTYPAAIRIDELASQIENAAEQPPMFLVEIPANFHWLKAADMELAQAWRLHTRALFESLFGLGYLVTVFIFLSGALPRSFYVLSYGQSSL